MSPIRLGMFKKNIPVFLFIKTYSQALVMRSSCILCNMSLSMLFSNCDFLIEDKEFLMHVRLRIFRKESETNHNRQLFKLVHLALTLEHLLSFSTYVVNKSRGSRECERLLLPSTILPFSSESIPFLFSHSPFFLFFKNITWAMRSSLLFSYTQVSVLWTSPITQSRSFLTFV